MRVRLCSSLLVAIMALGMVAALASTPLAVPQLDASNYSAEALREATAAIDQLRPILSNRGLGAQRSLGQDGWSPLDFAQFSAGGLAERGYRTYIAVDGARAWVFVELQVAGMSVWIPIDYTPASGEPQETLGRVPFAAVGGNPLAVDGRFLSYGSLTPVGSDTPPVAQFRFSVLEAVVGTPLALLASGSYDPDGRIVVYRWCIDGGECISTTSWSVSIVPSATSSVLQVTLFVVDNGGRSSSVTAMIPMEVQMEHPLPPPSPSCGCGSK